MRIAGYDTRFHRDALRTQMGYLPQDFGVYNSLSLYHYLSFFAARCGMTEWRERRQRIDEVIDLVGLSHVGHKTLKSFSGGMRQRAAIAQLLLKPGAVIVVDEPTAGLDPVERVRFRLLLSELARTRIVILSTHIVDDVTSSCRDVAILNHGEVIFQGSMEKARKKATGWIWDLIVPADEGVDIPDMSVLYKKHVHGEVLYHYVAQEPLPGASIVEPSFEDAYAALLFMNNAGDHHHRRRAGSGRVMQASFASATK